MFKLTEEKVTIEEEEWTVYGIMYDSEYYVPDISADRERVESMVDLFNKSDLAPCHLYDVVEDMLD